MPSIKLPRGKNMNVSSHYSMVRIVPQLYYKCKSLVGKRVRIYYSNGMIITAFLRKIINETHIYVNSEVDGLIHIPITKIEQIDDC